MAELTPIYLPKETVSDDSYRLVAVAAESGSKIKANQVIASFETSKALIEVTSPHDGYIHYRLRVGERVAIGNLVAIVSQSSDFPSAAFEKFAGGAPPPSLGTSQVPNSGNRISKAAAELIRQHGLEAKLFSHLELVKRSDVENFLASKGKTSSTKSISLEERIKKISGECIVIIGGGGHAKICIDILRHMAKFSIVGIIDNDLPVGTSVLDIPVIGSDADLANLKKLGVTNAVNGVGAVTNHKKRSKLFQHLIEMGFALPNLIHPAAAIEPSVSLGYGNHIMAHATIGSAVVIANNCIVNSGSVVSHDCVLQDNVHLAPGAILAGAVQVGHNTLIGMGSTIYFGVSVGSEVQINNGVNLAKDVADGAIVKR